MGPSTGPADYGDDFEHNDSASSWEDKSSWFWFNNAQANQRGLGGSKYYFEWKDAVRNPGYYDEVQKWRKGIGLQQNINIDRPEKRFAWTHDGVIKGFFIPVADITSLKNGDLDPLFGWYSGDMAAYVRDVLGPKLDDDMLEIYIDQYNCTDSGLPPAHVIIEQGEFKVNIRNDNPDKYAQCVTTALKWGIVPNTDPPTVNADGLVETDAIYRWSAIYILWEDTVNDPSRSPPISLVPKDGVLKSVWSRDTFNRKSVNGSTGIVDDLGYLQLGCTPAPSPEGSFPTDCWYFIGDPPPAGDESCGQDFALTIPPGVDLANSWAQVPVTGVPTLNANYGKIYGEMDLNVVPGNITTVMALTRNNQPVAWAEIRDGSKPIVGVGGSFANKIPITDGAATQTGAQNIGVQQGGTLYSQFELALDPNAKTVSLTLDGSEVVKLDYSATAFNASKVDNLRVWTDGSITLDQIALLSGMFTAPPEFVRGDSNNDGKMDISDPIHLLSYKFLGQEKPHCLDSADANDDGDVDQTDAVVILTYLFINSQVPLPPPFGFIAGDLDPLACGPDPTDDDPLDCQGALVCP